MTTITRLKNQFLTEEAFQIYSACMYMPTWEKFCTKAEKLINNPLVSIFAYMENDSIIGILSIKTSEDQTAEILGIAVKTSHRQKGIAQQLIAYAFENVQFSELHAETDDDAIAFYRNCGFTTEEFYLNNGTQDYKRYRCILSRGVQELTQIIKSSKLMSELLISVQTLDLNEYYIGAGCMTQTVWNHKFGKPHAYGIKDIDIVYFDRDHMDSESENEMELKIKAKLEHLGIKIDVKNQASVHLWYHHKFGKEIQPYASLEAAIDSWPTTATALGIRVDSNKGLKVYAPFGLEDLFNGIVRPNKKQITQNIYEAKASAWKEKWPELEITEW